ncbi:hypothetical protein F5Y15DRAFT_193004 [Xylariaceae sp. FL0016]|nr:hypothetical protein F5Y15DRAFT_193004 [Xylariaceae sp. FL0016]
MSSQMSDAAKSRPTPPGPSGWFVIPAPLARLFKKFPLLTYPPNELPARSSSVRNLPVLYVFISDEDALRGLPSYNPSCLKWQTFLKLAGIQFTVSPSNNHASPTGALPFLLPTSRPNDTKPRTPVSSNKLEQYAIDHGTPTIPEESIQRIEAYETLLDHGIRNAWLYALYLSHSNTKLLTQLYVAPTSTSQVVRSTVLYQLRRAAESEILRSISRPRIDPAALYKGAAEAFEALNTVLADGPWFFDSAQPGLFDATVFSYTHLLLSDSLLWENRQLTEILEGFPALIEHRNRILRRCWGSIE